MKTYSAKLKDVQRKWYLVDANDKVLGRISTIIANKLRGKDKPIFSPNIDCGDFVIVINAEKIKLTGAKMSDKLYSRHSGFPGGLKQEPAADLLKKDPTKILELSIRGMLPRNRLRKGFMQKLKLYAGEKHPHEAQNPEILSL